MLGDPCFPNQVLKKTRGTRIRQIQELYRKYSRYAISRDIDRHLAIQGLESRLKSTLGLSGEYGVFDDDPDGSLFCRTLLWRRADDERPLTRINSLATGQPLLPSWSPLAYAGAIDYFIPSFSGVDWRLFNIRPPRHFDRHNPRLPFVVRRITVDPIVFNATAEQIVYDCTPYVGALKAEAECVVVAQTLTGSSSSNIEYYVLFVVRHKDYSLESNPVYERVGAGRVNPEFFFLEHTLVAGFLC